MINKHIHIVLSGRKELITEFFTLYRRRLARYLSTKSQAPMNIPSEFKMCLKPLADLNAIRNVIVYVNRNGYLTDSDSTPFSYKWGTGRYYFNDFPILQRIEDLTKNELRAFLKSSTNDLPGYFSLIDDHIAPSSFCDVKSGMSMFRDAHHYFNMVSRSVESYSGLATEMDDGEFLTDEELFRELHKILNSKYNTSYIKQLTPAQRLDMARELHFKYRSSNGQIRRLLNLTQYEVDRRNLLVSEWSLCQMILSITGGYLASRGTHRRRSIKKEILSIKKEIPSTVILHMIIRISYFAIGHS